MVNELNKPPDNAALSELLEASNRQLQEMQEEHRQLQAELERLSVHRQQLRMATREQVSESISVTQSTGHSGSTAVAAETSSEADKDNVSEEDKEETANYLQEKLAEIANLKAQFKRVQQMTDSTKRIEQHMSSIESQSSSSTRVQQSSRQTMTSESVQSSSSSSSSTSSASSTSRSAVSGESAESAEPTSRAVPDNAELLNAMINMVTDFTSDLRGQEESLRAERLRIKTLKEEIIQRKQSK